MKRGERSFFPILLIDESRPASDFRATVMCGGRRHGIRLDDGHFVLENHDMESEHVLKALGGPPPKCLELLSIWQAPWTFNDIWLVNRNTALSSASTLKWGNGRIPNETARKLSRDRPVPWWFRTILGLRVGFELREQSPERVDDTFASLIRESTLPTEKADIVCWPSDVSSAFFGWSDGRMTWVAYFDPAWGRFINRSSDLTVDEGYLVLYNSPNRPGLRGVISWEPFGDGFLAHVRWGQAGTKPRLHAIT